jgi:hypothetical protein
VVQLDSERIFNFDWSRAGYLTISRGTESSYVILIRGFQGKDGSLLNSL